MIGGGGIRTPETLSRLTVFKTVAFSRSATPPGQYYLNCLSRYLNLDERPAARQHTRRSYHPPGGTILHCPRKKAMT